MNKLVRNTNITNWLESKLVNCECGILLELQSGSSFDTIQNFIESYELPFQTLVT